MAPVVIYYIRGDNEKRPAITSYAFKPKEGSKIMSQYHAKYFPVVLREKKVVRKLSPHTTDGKGVLNSFIRAYVGAANITFTLQVAK